jgi:hypothetical protein
MARVRRSGEGAVDLVLYVSPHSRYALTAQHTCRALLARFCAGDVHLSNPDPVIELLESCGVAVAR